MSRQWGRRGFTLTELLVVIGIIALLLAILMPALAKARRAANATVCASNLRQITHAMYLYAAQNRDYFPGGAYTTSRFLFTDSFNSNPVYPSNNSFCPNIVDNWDWMSPLLKVLAIPFEEGGSWDQRLARFEHLRAYALFQCPENGVLAGPWAPGGTPTGGPAVAVDRAMSYATAIYFHLQPNRASGGGLWGRTQCGPDLTTPSGHVPMLAKIRNSSRKIFIADGARYSTTTEGPSIGIPLRADNGGAFGDMGAFSSISHSWNRTLAPGNNGVGHIDARIFAFRHGRTEPNGPADTYKLNVAFFDGHVETMGDLQASDPSLWLPTGSWYDPSIYAPMPADAAARYGGNVGRYVP